MEGYVQNSRQVHLNCKDVYIQQVKGWGASCPQIRAVTSPTVQSCDISELDKFSTKFADVEKIRRSKIHSRKELVNQNKRKINQARQDLIKEHQDNYTTKKMENIAQSQLLHSHGMKKDGHTNGLPLNPINNIIHNTPTGQKMKVFEAQIVAKHLARAQNLQLRGTCGYNPINGQSPEDIIRLVPSGFQDEYIKMVVEQSDAYNMKTGWLQSRK